MNIEMALKSRSYILDFDLVKLSLGSFYFLSCLMKSFFYQLSGSTFIFCQNTHQNAVNLMFGLILPVAKVSWLFLGVQYIPGPVAGAAPWCLQTGRRPWPATAPSSRGRGVRKVEKGGGSGQEYVRRSGEDDVSHERRLW